MTCENESVIKIIKGQDKVLNVKVSDEKSCDPFDMTGVIQIRATLKETVNNALTNFSKWYLVKTADTTLGLDVVTLDTTDIEEGEKIQGVGIPVGATVLKIPTSTVSPSAPGTIKISVPASATGAGVSLTIGDIEIVGNPVLGKFKIPLSETDTENLTCEGFEVKIVKGSDTQYIQFEDIFQIVDRF